MLGGNISHEQGAQDLEPRQNVQNGSLSGNPLATDEALKEQSTSNGAGTPNTGGGLPADTTDPQYNQSGAVELGYENSKKVYVIDWYGPDDPEVYQSDEIESSAKKLMYMQNPMNWSSTIRFWITFEICFPTLAVYIGSGAGRHGKVWSRRSRCDFRTHNLRTVSLTACSLLLNAMLRQIWESGYGLGPMLWSPMSEIPAIGRNSIYIWTLAAFVVFQVPTALSVNIGMFL